MTWFLLAAVALALVVRFARHRYRRFAVSQSQPISTLQVVLSRKQSIKKRAALDAASSTLR
jgi:hypothetical protein